MSRGRLFRELLLAHTPLPIVGTINAYCALLAQTAGHRAIYLSGGGVAAASFGQPDLAITTANDVIEDARRITASCPLPLLVDIDTGFGGAFNIARTVRELIRIEVAAVHIEDQVGQKRCGHRPNKQLVSCAEMVDRVKAAVDAKTDAAFVIMARTDALAAEGMQAAIDRACAYVEAGADMIFPEAVHSLDQYAEFSQAVGVPVLANITEFGQSPLFSREALSGVGVKMVLYPLSVFRIMSQAALLAYEHLHRADDQRELIDSMQTREQLYKILGYQQYEDALDRLFERLDAPQSCD